MDNINCDRFKNKICLVTGSSMGIGLAIATRFGEEGAIVLISSRNKSNLGIAEESLDLKSIKYDSYVCDITDRTQRKKMLEKIKEKYGRIDVLVCNVSVSMYFGLTIDTNEKIYDKTFDTNVKNTFYTIQDSLELLKVSNNSKVLIVSSWSGYNSFPLIGIYSVTKSAMIALTRVLAEELANFGIRVNCIAPGIVKTKLASLLVDSELSRANFLGRYALPEEMSGASAFLCSDDSSYITGETISLTGGKHTRF